MRRPPASSEPRDGGQAPGVLHHAMGRVIGRTKIFSNKTDQQDFLKVVHLTADNLKVVRREMAAPDNRRISGYAG